MLYLLAILFPPAAVFLAGKPFQAVINVLLTLLLYFPGLLHALFVVNNHYADKRTKRVVQATDRAAAQTVAAFGDRPRT